MLVKVKKKKINKKSILIFGITSQDGSLLAKHYIDKNFTVYGVVTSKKLLFSKKTKPNHSIFNVCSNKPIKITKIINFFQNKYGGVKIKKILRNKLDVKNTHGSNKKVKKVTSFSKFTDYKSGVKNSFEWYNKYKIHKIIQSVKNEN